MSWSSWRALRVDQQTKPANPPMTMPVTTGMVWICQTPRSKTHHDTAEDAELAASKYGGVDVVVYAVTLVN